jgi:hypothetical protein
MEPETVWFALTAAAGTSERKTGLGPPVAHLAFRQGWLELERAA